MTQTFIALAFAHVLADFVLQPGWMAARKKEPGVLLLHTTIVLIAAMFSLGRVDAWELLVLAAAHLAIDAIKAYVLPDTFGAYVADQAAHFATILAIAVLAPNLWQSGVWANAPDLLASMLYLGGFIFATRAGGFAVGKLMDHHTAELPADQENGLPGGGMAIGMLERGLIFILIIVGQPGAIGFLIAAKSILRFGTVQENRAASEYVIIGTLASFGWAIAVAFATIRLAELLPGS